MKPAVVFLDWDGTVCDSKFWGHWSNDSTYNKANVLIQRYFFHASPEIITEWMRGEWDVEKIVAEISHRTGLAAKDLHTGLQESCERMQLFDGILPAIANLRKNNIRVLVATDNMDTFTRWTVPALGLDNHFDGILDSYSLKALKRDKDAAGRSKFFARYLAKSHIDPMTAVLVDDSAHNAAVQDFGLQYIQVTPQSSALDILSSFSTK
jgi:FMN phosphatase YigB (HAD superfamily)